MEIGTLVKVEIPYKLGEIRIGKRYKTGRVAKIYKNFILLEFDTKSNISYKECYRKNEIIMI